MNKFIVFDQSDDSNLLISLLNSLYPDIEIKIEKKLDKDIVIDFSNIILFVFQNSISVLHNKIIRENHSPKILIIGNESIENITTNEFDYIFEKRISKAILKNVIDILLRTINSLSLISSDITHIQKLVTSKENSIKRKFDSFKKKINAFELEVNPEKYGEILYGTDFAIIKWNLVGDDGSFCIFDSKSSIKSINLCKNFKSMLPEDVLDNFFELANEDVSGQLNILDHQFYLNNDKFEVRNFFYVISKSDSKICLLSFITDILPIKQAYNIIENKYSAIELILKTSKGFLNLDNDLNLENMNNSIIDIVNNYHLVGVFILKLNKNDLSHELLIKSSSKKGYDDLVNESISILIDEFRNDKIIPVIIKVNEGNLKISDFKQKISFHEIGDCFYLTSFFKFENYNPDDEMILEFLSDLICIQAKMISLSHKEQNIKDMFNNFFEQSRNPVIWLDCIDFRIMNSNENFSEIIGLTKDELEGNRLSSFFPETKKNEYIKFVNLVEEYVIEKEVDIDLKNILGEVIPLTMVYSIREILSQKVFEAFFYYRDEEKQLKQKLEYLTNMSRTLRSINKLSFKYDDNSELLPFFCKSISSSYSVYSSWILFFDGDKKIVYHDENRIEYYEKIIEKIRNNESISCVEKALQINGVAQVRNDDIDLEECTQSTNSLNNIILSGVLKHNDINYGVLIVEFDHSKITTVQAVTMFREINEDISYAIYSNFLNKAKRKMENDLPIFTKIFEQNTASVVVTNEHGLIEYVNQKFCETSGYSQYEVIGRNPSFINSGLLPKEHFKNMWETINKGNEWRGEFHNKSKNGNCYWEYAIISPIKNDSEIITHFVAVKEDITKDKERAEELRKKEKRISRIFENIHDVFFESDFRFKILEISPSVKSVLNIDRKDIVGKNIRNVILNDEEIDNFLSKIFEEGTIEDFEIGYKYQNADKFLSISGKMLMEDSNENLIIGTIKDITRKKRIENVLRQMNKELSDSNRNMKEMQAQLIQNEKLASIGHLAAGIAHEINNPTGFIISNLKTIKEYFDDVKSVLEMYRQLDHNKIDENILMPIIDLEKKIDIDYLYEDFKDMINESLEGADRIKDIVQNLRNFSRIDKIDQMEPVFINEGIESTLRLVNNELKYDIDIHKNLNIMPKVIANMGQLNQVFANILVNASQAIKTMDRTERGNIWINSSINEGYQIVSFKNDGPRIPDHIIDKIFDPFFTTKEVGKGTGLGLNISWDIIVNKHGGKIEVESNDDFTLFTISIPNKTVNEDL
ncbi:MAG: PAS domain S-box protein [Candidatus Delongbacteria bacterium]|nr:PAS domain S-box protein [Candidatus Delongbacteria bacterium]MBN2835235.1 PAS domain S-box protein [Candidatus Delongbacteria bacterium]